VTVTTHFSNGRGEEGAAESEAGEIAQERAAIGERGSVRHYSTSMLDSMDANVRLQT
jgi:hypothetical protein